ncbi:MAG TPA: hypothetical protein VFQ60_01845 [Patescibacteria group bacterium]|nr:hypothetical protein [Patescibacteria group bacterium]
MDQQTLNWLQVFQETSFRLWFVQFWTLSLIISVFGCWFLHKLEKIQKQQKKIAEKLGISKDEKPHS